MKQAPWFDFQAAIARAEAALAEPPAKEWIERPPALGELVARFALPLELCKPMNLVARRQGGRVAAPWAITRMKQNAFEAMTLQAFLQGMRMSGLRLVGGPLPGRPQVRCVRFSSTAPDRFADWAKNPVDRLCSGKRGMGLLADDRPACARIEQWWEPGKRGAGFVYVEVRTG